MYVIAVHPTLSNDVFAILDDKMEEKALLRVGLEPLYFNPGDLPIEPSQQSRCLVTILLRWPLTFEKREKGGH